MSRGDYLCSMFGPFFTKVFRFSGILPVTVRPRHNSKVVFSHCFFFYGIVLLVVLGPLLFYYPLQRPNGSRMENFLRMNSIAYSTIMYVNVTLIIMSSIINCKRGLFCNIILNFQLFDNTTSFQSDRKWSGVVGLTVLTILIISILFISYHTENKFQSIPPIISWIVYFIFYACELLIYQVMHEIWKRFKFVNNSLKETIKMSTLGPKSTGDEMSKIYRGKC